MAVDAPSADVLGDAFAALDRTADLARARSGGARAPIVAVSGAQGSGKSTLARAYAERRGGLHLSLDDFYLTRAEREALARDIHPLFATRGPPGTHDILLMGDTIGALITAAPGARTPLPRFDKGRDERAPRADWRVHDGRPALIVLEGWCLGATIQREDALAAPVNALEADEDPKGVWRRYANAHLGAAYHDLFVCLDAILFLQAPDFSIVTTWRCEQESRLLGRALREDERAGVARFVAHFERLTRHMLAGGRRADIVASLDERRAVLRVK